MFITEARVTVCLLQLAEGKGELLSSALQCWIARHFTHSLQRDGLAGILIVQCHALARYKLKCDSTWALIAKDIRSAAPADTNCTEIGQ